MSIAATNTSTSGWMTDTSEMTLLFQGSSPRNRRIVEAANFLIRWQS